jgi:hypothetical protein
MHYMLALLLKQACACVFVSCTEQRERRRRSPAILASMFRLVVTAGLVSAYSCLAGEQRGGGSEEMHHMLATLLNKTLACVFCVLQDSSEEEEEEETSAIRADV